MAAVTQRLIDPGEGTPEAEWLPWLDATSIQAIAAEALVPEGSRAVVVAPHPDDEVLAVGGLLSCLAALGRELRIIAVTDGTASHPGSSRWPPDVLERIRPAETRRALALLGVPHDLLRLGLPDGGLKALRPLLADALIPLLLPGDVVFTTWSADGHPDHEATGQATALAATCSGATVIEVPVWGWHWAKPGDRRMPWRRARRVLLDGDASARKRSALQAFESQMQPDPSTGSGPVLRNSTLARAARPFEVVFA
ncbi:PIG-L family deacetylase [Variovorax humicola]|uniref:PIG-L family deacetylase n=1 Tax=Variovorax humicola TaxID=1769758 RepID=A0ABU8W9W2_9BURK